MNIVQNKKIIIAAAIGAVLIGKFSIDAYANGAAKEKLDEFIIENELPVTYTNVKAGWFTNSVTIEEIAIAEKMKVNSLTIDGFDPDKRNLQDELSIEIEGAHLQPNQLPREYKQIYDELGYTGELLVNATAAYSYDAEERLFDLEEFSAGIDDVGEISTSFKIGNFDLTEEAINSLLFTWGQLDFIEAELKYTDDEFMERFWESVTKNQKASVSEVKAKVIKQLQGEFKARNEFQKDAMAEFFSFIEDSDELTLKAEPNKPVSFRQISRIRSPIELIDTLGLEVDG